jgi:hypothetical protein
MNLEELAELYPILNFDPDPKPIINPPVGDDLSSKLVICFFKDVVEKVASEFQAGIAHTFRSEGGLYYRSTRLNTRVNGSPFCSPGLGLRLGLDCWMNPLARERVM